MLGGSVPILVVGVHFTAGMLQSNNLVIADNNINDSMTSTSTLFRVFIKVNLKQKLNNP